jgi:hypothetical protein
LTMPPDIIAALSGVYLGLLEAIEVKQDSFSGAAPPHPRLAAHLRF